MNSWNGGTKLSGWYFLQQIWRHAPLKKAKIWCGNWKEREMCRDATWQKPKLSKCVDLRALMDSWWDWNSRMAARLNLRIREHLWRIHHCNRRWMTYWNPFLSSRTPSPPKFNVNWGALAPMEEIIRPPKFGGGGFNKDYVAGFEYVVHSTVFPRFS